MSTASSSCAGSSAFPGSGYYAWRGRPDSDPSATDKDLTSLIRVIYQRLRCNPAVHHLTQA